ncbi:hypothetical protein GX48_07923 [Paracoccidioides brasiliensis]|nr:hypothetical protein GX48_07923 [Paracoccidioides brasiliensis]
MDALEDGNSAPPKQGQKEREISCRLTSSELLSPVWQVNLLTYNRRKKRMNAQDELAEYSKSHYSLLSEYDGTTEVIKEQRAAKKGPRSKSCLAKN